MAAQVGIISTYFGPSVMHLIGILSVVLLLLGMIYTAKRKRPGFPGSLAFWMAAHRWGTGLATVLAFLHSDLSWSVMPVLTLSLMIAVSASGVLGSYIHARIPRTRAGKEMEVAELERRLAMAEHRAARSGVPYGRSRAADGGVEGFYAGLREMGRTDAEMRGRAVQGGESDRLGREVILRRMELENAERGQALLRKWREWHVPLSMLFFATLTIHVASVYYY